MCQIVFKRNRVLEIVGDKENSDKFYGTRHLEYHGWIIDAKDDLISCSYEEEQNGKLIKNMFVINQRRNLITNIIKEYQADEYGFYDTLSKESGELLSRSFRKTEWAGDGLIWLSGTKSAKERICRVRTKEFLEKLHILEDIFGVEISGVRKINKQYEDSIFVESGTGWSLITNPKKEHWICVDEKNYHLDDDFVQTVRKEHIA